MAVGECRYGFICDQAGTVLCDPVMLRPFEDTFWLSHGNIDLLLWAKGVGVGAGMDAEVSEPDIPPLQVQGPKSGDVMAALSGGSTDRLGHFRCMPVTVAGVDSIVSRTGWSHELGYEIYPLGSDRALELWDAVVEAGRPYDMMITWTEHRPRRRVRDHGHEPGDGHEGQRPGGEPAAGRPGRRGLHRPRCAARGARAGRARRQVGLLGPERRLPRLESEWALRQNGEQVGATRWVTFSPRLGRAIAIGLVRADLAEPGVELLLDHPDGGDPVEVTELPFVARSAEGG